MKTIIRFVLLLNPVFLFAQITTPVIRANFGVDGDLRANYFNGALQSGNDDWFNNGSAGSGLYVIDTFGAAAKVAGYLSDISPWPRRMASFYRVMSRPTFSINNNRLWLDALFVRDYHGQDTTTFAAGSNKNGQSPDDWTGVVQGVPDKNDILDMFVHIRRAGPNSTDSLWLFGGISMDNTTGNRYFDFEMYQSDINYDRASQQFYGYGPDFGHTTWLFDAAGNVIKHVPLPGAGLADLMKEKRRYMVIQFEDADLGANGTVNFRIENKSILQTVIPALGKKANMSPRGEAYYRPHR